MYVLVKSEGEINLQMYRLEWNIVDVVSGVWSKQSPVHIGVLVT